MISRLRRIIRSLTSRFHKGDDAVIKKTSLRELQNAINYTFKDEQLLIDALIHRSYLPESDQEEKDIRSNERLEYLGDAVLSLVVNNHLFRKYPQKSEGELTKMKSIIVSKQILSHYAKKNRLGSFILMSENAQKAGVNGALSVLADTLEAVFGAVFLDGGFESASRCIQGLLLSDLREIVFNEEHVNYKSLLQEYIQALHKQPPRYSVVATSGPEHDKEFDVEVSVRGNVLGKGNGKTKKLAEQEAAKEAYKKLLNTPNFQKEGI